jgi:hypothetical protein
MNILHLFAFIATIATGVALYSGKSNKDYRGLELIVMVVFTVLLWASSEFLRIYG